jgi:transposase
MVGGIENEGESMPRTRKSHPPSLKAKVAVEAIKAHKTAAQIAQMFGVHPTQVGGWKKQALAGLPDIFGNGREHMRQQDRTPQRPCTPPIAQFILATERHF